LPSVENEIQSKLLSFYQKRFASRENIGISHLTRITDGWENEVYSFTIEYEEAIERTHRDLILRIYPGDGAHQKAAREFNGMKKLHELEFPVPEVLVLGLDDSPFAKPFVIMEKIHGRLMGQIIAESPDGKRQELITLCCRMFVDLHNLDWRPFASDPSLYETGDPYTFIKNWLSTAQRYGGRFQRNEFAPILAWLEERYLDVPCERLSVIHFDYHPHNILLREDGKAFVIDWTNIGVADFRMDLAWTLLLTSTYGNPEAREIVLNEYERVAEHSVEQIEYFEVAASFRRLFSISVSLSDGAGKLGMRPEAVALMKQNVGHIENVYSVLYNRTGITISEIETLLSTLS
jgi:aminoglycoside phosphotransferase (APT) family kinase protein